MSLKFKGWSDLEIKRQFWYLTALYPEEKIQKERSEIVQESLSRGIVKECLPFPRAGCGVILE